MRDLRIDGKLKRGFVLKETDERILFIPLTVLTRTDYNRLLEIEEKTGAGVMLNTMRDTKLDNGRNALALYDALISVLIKNGKDGNITTRLPKPNEPGAAKAPDAPVAQSSPVGQKGETPKPRRRGRPPKKKTEDTTES